MGNNCGCSSPRKEYISRNFKVKKYTCKKCNLAYNTNRKICQHHIFRKSANCIHCNLHKSKINDSMCYHQHY